VVGFAQQEGKAKGWAYLVVLVADEGAEEDLGAWRVGRQRRPPSRRRRHEREQGRERVQRARWGDGMEKGRGKKKQNKKKEAAYRTIDRSGPGRPFGP